MIKSKFNKPLTVALTKDVYAQVKACSDEKDVSMAEVVRNILECNFVKTVSKKSDKSGSLLLG